MKGLVKGFRYISQIFYAEEEKEEEIQIGLPTDVKHVAHIGNDGPSVETPSWMKEFKQSQDSSSNTSSATQCSRRGNKEMEASENPKAKKDPTATTKTRRKRNPSKDMSEANLGSTAARQQPEELGHSPSRNVPDMPKGTHRKKTREATASAPRPRSKPDATTNTSS